MSEMSSSDPDSPVTLQKRVWFYALLILIFAVAVFLLLFRKNTPPYTTKDAIRMGTYMRICLGTEKNPHTLIDAMMREVTRVENKYSFHNEENILAEINRNGENWTYVDEETRFILERSYELALITKGAFDPALGRLTKLWGFDQIDKDDFVFRVPTPEEIETALKASGYRNLEIQEDTVRLINGALLDLGGIVKGYAIDRCVQVARELDPDATGYVDIGGDIGIIGPKFGGADWIIGVQSPREIEGVSLMASVFMKTGGIATSGDYQRYNEIEGQRYHHILNAETGKPSTGTVSATVIAQNSMDADAFATAGMILDEDYVLQILPRLGGQALLIDPKLSKRSTDGWASFEKNDP